MVRCRKPKSLILHVRSDIPKIIFILCPRPSKHWEFPFSMQYRFNANRLGKRRDCHGNISVGELSIETDDIHAEIVIGFRSRKFKIKSFLDDSTMKLQNVRLYN
jgi:hypothetical protein